MWGAFFSRGQGVAAPVLPAEPVDYVSVDVETACRRVCSICAIGLVGFRGGEIAFEVSTLVDPEDDFDPMNVAIHGIEPPHVKRAPRWPSVAANLVRPTAGRPVVSHGTFDRRALEAAATKHRLPVPEPRWADSVAIARRVWPSLSDHKLPTLARHLGLSLRHHDPLSDARVAGQVVAAAMRETGLELAALTAASRDTGVRHAAVRSVAPGQAGPLAGHQVVITGDLSVGRSEAAARIVAAGGGVAGSPSRKTTLLVLGAQDPATFAGKPKSAKHMKAEALIAEGQALRIIHESELWALIDQNRRMD